MPDTTWLLKNAIEQDFNFWIYWPDLGKLDIQGQILEINGEARYAGTKQDQLVFVVLPQMYAIYNGPENPETHSALFR